MKRTPRSHQHHDSYEKYRDHDSEISDLLGECGFIHLERLIVLVSANKEIMKRMRKIDNII